MAYGTIEECIAHRLGVIEGQLKRRSFEEDLVLALTLLRRLWVQFAGEFSLSDSFGEPANLLQTHAVAERRLFLDFLAGSPWPPLRSAVFHLERLFRASASPEEPPALPRWFIDLAAAIEGIGACCAGSPLDRIERAANALSESHAAFSEGVGETVVRTMEQISVRSYQAAEPSASWAFNLASAILSPELGLSTAGTPLPSLVRRQVFRPDLDPIRRRAILGELLDASSAALVSDLEDSARIIATALAELRRGRKHSRSADAYVLIAGAGDLSVRQLSVLLGVSNEGARKIVAQMLKDGLLRTSSANTIAVRSRGGSACAATSAWDSSLITPTPLARAFDER